MYGIDKASANIYNEKWIFVFGRETAEEGKWESW